jgi:hypothetical protein
MKRTERVKKPSFNPKDIQPSVSNRSLQGLSTWMMKQLRKASKLSWLIIRNLTILKRSPILVIHLRVTIVQRTKTSNRERTRLLRSISRGSLLRKRGTMISAPPVQMRTNFLILGILHIQTRKTSTFFLTLNQTPFQT